MMVPYHGATFDGTAANLVPMNSSFLSASLSASCVVANVACFFWRQTWGRQTQHEMTATEKRRQPSVVFSRWKGKGNERRHRSNQGEAEVCFIKWNVLIRAYEGSIGHQKEHEVSQNYRHFA